jgi:hypothetical protein
MGGRDAQNDGAYNRAQSEYDSRFAAARTKNDEATAHRNSEYSRYGGYQDKINALTAKLKELGVGRKVRIKGNE